LNLSDLQENQRKFARDHTVIDSSRQNPATAFYSSYVCNIPATRTESHIATHYYSSKKQHIVYFAESISRLVFQMSKTIYSFFQLSLQNKFVFGFVLLFVVGKPKKDTFSKAMNATIFF